MTTRHRLFALLIVLFATGAALAQHTADAPTDEDEGEELVTCTVRIAYAELEQEATAGSPTVEESEEAAIDAACALHCAESLTPDSEDDEESAEDSPDEATEEGESGAEDDAGVEACIEACFDSAEVLGLRCWDPTETILSEGSFGSDSDDEDDSDEDGE